MKRSMTRSFAAAGQLPAVVLSLLAASAATAQPRPTPTPVEVYQRDGAWKLRQGDEDIEIRGAGGQSRLGLLAEYGGNSFRTWGHERAKENFADAERHGLRVTMGVWLGHPRHGFDYDNIIAVNEQQSWVREVVGTHRYEPSLLLWGLGNEVELAADPRKVFPEIDRVAQVAKAIDPWHPTMTVIAGCDPEKVRAFMELCPNVDILGINAYGEAHLVPEKLAEAGYKGPYILTEYGPRGHWESPTAPWGAPIEPTSAEKREMYRRAYETAVLGQSKQCLGSYVFLWGDKQETTATWFGMFLPTGEKTPTVDIMSELWTGTPVEHPAPVVAAIESEVALAEIDPGQRFEASVTLDRSAPQPSRVSVEWLIVPETTDRRMGGDAERAPEPMPTLTRRNAFTGAAFVAPDRPGPYRLFVTVRDAHGGAGTANVPFFVRDPDV